MKTNDRKLKFLDWVILFWPMVMCTCILIMNIQFYSQVATIMKDAGPETETLLIDRKVTIPLGQATVHSPSPNALYIFVAPNGHYVTVTHQVFTSYNTREVYTAHWKLI